VRGKRAAAEVLDAATRRARELDRALDAEDVHGALDLLELPRHVVEPLDLLRVRGESLDRFLDPGEVHADLFRDDADELLVFRFGERRVAHLYPLGGRRRLAVLQRLQPADALVDLAAPIGRRTMDIA